MPTGFLAVFSEPGKQVSIEEFQDWYNNEHVPLRLNHLTSFLTGARFSAADSLKPSWLAVYDVDDTSTFQHESYTRLRANRSLREANIIQRLEILDRRTCSLISDSGESKLTSSFESRNPTKFVVTQGITLHGTAQLDKDRAFGTWIRNTFQLLEGTEGWLRTRAYKCIENVRSGTLIGNEPDEQIVPAYLIVHELTSSFIGESSTFRDMLPKSGAGVDIIEVRQWDLYRAYPSISQGSVERNLG